MTPCILCSTVCRDIMTPCILYSTVCRDMMTPCILCSTVCRDIMTPCILCSTVCRDNKLLYLSPKYLLCQRTAQCGHYTWLISWFVPTEKTFFNRETNSSPLTEEESSNQCPEGIFPNSLFVGWGCLQYLCEVTSFLWFGWNYLEASICPCQNIF